MGVCVPDLRSVSEAVPACPLGAGHAGATSRTGLAVRETGAISIMTRFLDVCPQCHRTA
jgi:hypothetical protein